MRFGLILSHLFDNYYLTWNQYFPKKIEYIFAVKMWKINQEFETPIKKI